MTLDTLDTFLKDAGDRVIYKPVGNAQGIGIKVYIRDDYSKIWNDIQNKPKAIIEEWIEQHKELSHVYSDAVNCIRIITVYRRNEAHFLAGGITWGLDMKIANASASGIVSPIDFPTGILKKPAADFEGNVYNKHPVSGADLVGLQLPFWDETKQMICKAATLVPQIGYVGWDVAITPKGPVIIKGNTELGYKYYQIPAHMTNKTGNKEIYADFLKD